MAPQQYLLRGSSLEDVTRQAVELYGPEARIVSADSVLDPGLRGLMGRRHVEATVTVPTPIARLAPSVDPAGPHALGPHALEARAGIAALLEDADRAEDGFLAAAPGARPSAPSVSTEAEDFDALLERLRTQMDAPEERVPVLLDGAGDLVLVVGRGETALAVVQSMAARLPEGFSLVSAGGLSGDWPHLEDVRDAVAARAEGVESGTTVLAALGLRGFDRLAPQFGRAAALRPDQVWLAVDARHKAEETAEWVEAAKARLTVSALALVGTGETRTPETVNALGIPLGWVDGSRAPRTVL
ncbi:hypothetical protein [Sinomonas humi]|uniref:hypothetical protein n=1 Tax=Sinomonas humi TaxID=1338436 RepID=UPI0012E098BE|nr:hypothetical protein [Sinomonas humi]